MNKIQKVLIIGLDCAPPKLIFDQYLSDLPNIRSLIERGIYGKLCSTIPAITCPAWMSMMTSKNPGKLGFYGFRNRADYSYDNMTIANSRLVKENTVWDILSQAGKTSILVGVPQTYPPKPLRGYMITSFLTPSTDSQYTYPPSLKYEIERVVDGYMLDVEGFRTEDKSSLLEQIYEMTEKRFTVARHLMQNKEWDFFMLVEMGPDRIHHGFWKYCDPEHRKYEPGSQYEHAIKDYYIYLDEEIGEMLKLIDDDTAVMLVSDHGAKRMDGGICVNEWLMQEGYLHLKEYPQQMVSLSDVEIDWPHTQAWGEGGYYARIFMNVKGREPNGVIKPRKYEKVRDEIAGKLEALGDENGKPIGTKVFKPQEIYPVVNGVPPDLIVYLGNLLWRSVGSVGLNTIHTFENDTGPDDANHDQYGIFVLAASGQTPEQRDGLHLMDVAPTVLSLLDVDVPEDMEGKAVE
ncbi:TPA: phosphodiesterase [Candidatus Poribacteria bacterium]|nr:phosphodiesterase [Candidatus Poribacteria bacterium]